MRKIYEIEKDNQKAVVYKDGDEYIVQWYQRRDGHWVHHEYYTDGQVDAMSTADHVVGA